MESIWPRRSDGTKSRRPCGSGSFRNCTFVRLLRHRTSRSFDSYDSLPLLYRNLFVEKQLMKLFVFRPYTAMSYFFVIALCGLLALAALLPGVGGNVRFSLLLTATIYAAVSTLFVVGQMLHSALRRTRQRKADVS